QQKFNYSILMKLAKKEEELIAIIEIIPHTTDVIKIINVFTIGIWIGSLILMLVIIIFFIKRLTYPLVAIKELADDISHLNFKKIEIQTRDELEELAESINRMSEKLEYSHKKLENKNKYMKQLLSDASHELKTPIALIKAYSAGMQDGIDDGTFLETIIEQNEMMDRTVNQLLNLCRIEQKEEKLEKVNISNLLESLIKSNKIYINQEKIDLVTQIEEAIWSLIDEEALVSIWTNFITNAIKYNTDNQMEIKLVRKEKKIYFEVSNGVSEKIVEHLPYIWKPFYVGEDSRNKDMCGTGLGLYIVQQLLQKFGMEYGVKVETGKIYFYMYLKEEL
ncbi:MAG: sensor histidine kinase, partial [Cellulosilyticaceae bacterium]